MATLDDLYTQLSKANKTAAPLQAVAQQAADKWLAALAQLRLPTNTPFGGRLVGAAIGGAPPGPTTIYSVSDLPGLANAYLQAQTAADAAKQAIDTLNVKIQTAIKAKDSA